LRKAYDFFGACHYAQPAAFAGFLIDFCFCHKTPYQNKEKQGFSLFWNIGKPSKSVVFAGLKTFYID
jgi:hypothetical protein